MNASACLVKSPLPRCTVNQSSRAAGTGTRRAT
jgi:hypothetical protein